MKRSKGWEFWSYTPFKPGDVKNLCSRWWRKFRNLLGYSYFRGVFRRKTKVIVVELIPFLDGQLQVVPAKWFQFFDRPGLRIRQRI